MLLSVVLDPRLKRLSFIKSEEKKAAIWEMLHEEVNKLSHRVSAYPESVGAVISSSSSASSSSVPSTTSKLAAVKAAQIKEQKEREAKEAADLKAKQTFRKLMGLEDEPEVDKTALTADEVGKYQTMPVADELMDPVFWWWEHRFELPRLTRLALRFLCIQSTSTPVERIWSTGGNIVTPKRCSLAADTVEEHIFLYENVAWMPDE
jgi:hypothetical protein